MPRNSSAKRGFGSRAFRLVTALLAAYLLAALALYLGQRWLIYLPMRAPEATMGAVAADAGLRPWRDSAGTIIGWRSQHAGGEVASNRLLVFHGNAGYALMRIHFVHGFESIDNGAAWEVTLFEYPHFGARPGTLGEKSIRAAAIEAVRQMKSEDSRPLFVLGESLGSGPACAVAAQEPQAVAGIVLITPYRSLAAMAHHRFPMFPTGWILRDRWDNDRELRQVRGPVAVLLAEHDEVIPIAQGRALFDSVAGPKRLWVLPGATHNTLPYELTAAWWREVSVFLLSDRTGK
jgi:pimeloyl-ACP methyl ester carboxylesterase